jgi:DNA polymerase-3 subunit gamma/tau
VVSPQRTPSTRAASAAQVVQVAPVGERGPGARFSPPTAAPALAAQEPPPWIDDEVPIDDGFADAMPSAPSYPLAADPPSPGPAAAAPLSMPAPTPLPMLQPTALGDVWAATIRPLAAAGGIAAMVRELAVQAELLAVQPGESGGRCWRLRVERETLRAPALAAKLAAALQLALDEPVQLLVEAGQAQDSIGKRDALARHRAARGRTDHPDRPAGA